MCGPGKAGDATETPAFPHDSGGLSRIGFGNIPDRWPASARGGSLDRAEALPGFFERMGVDSRVGCGALEYPAIRRAVRFEILAQLVLGGGEFGAAFFEALGILPVAPEQTLDFFAVECVTLRVLRQVRVAGCAFPGVAHGVGASYEVGLDGQDPATIG